MTLHPKMTPSESDAELNRRVAAATAHPKAPVVDHFTGKKVCHKFFTFVQTERPNPLNPHEIQIGSQAVNVRCIGGVCALWDDENKRCLDVSATLAQIETAKTLEIMDGLMRMSQEGGK